MAIYSNMQKPHTFKALRFWDKWRKYGRCKLCYVPKFLHPARYWVEARSDNDKSKAR